MKISSKFLIEWIWGIVVFWLCPGACRLRLLSADSIFLVRVISLFWALRQYFLLLISPKLCLICELICWKSNCWQGECTFSEVWIKEEMMDLLISILYLERSSRFSSVSIDSDYGSSYFFRRDLMRCRTPSNSDLLNCRERMQSCVLRSSKFKPCRSVNLSLGRGSIKLTDFLYRNLQIGIVSKDKQILSL